MRLFLTICSLAAVAYAKPQYNYAAGVSGSEGGSLLAAPIGSHGSSSGLGGGFSSGSLGGLSGGSLGGFSSGSLGGLGGGSLGGFSSGSSGGFSGGSLGGFSGGNFQSGGSSYQQGGFEAPLVHKQFYTIAAPEEHENLEHTKHFVIGRPQKNYRVVFIKAPSSNHANVKLSAEYAPKEEKTAIYVLSKKDSALEINDIATPAPTVPSKPEVFFIKYKTEQEAQHAQRNIQAEYDRIQGTSENVDGGIGHVQSVIGALGGGVGAGSSGVGGGSSGFGFGSGSSGFGVGSGSSGFGVGSGSSGFGVGGGSSGLGHSGAQSPTYLPPGK